MKNTCKLFVVVLLVVCLLSGVSAFATEKNKDSGEILDDLAVEALVEVVISENNRSLGPNAFLNNGAQADEGVSILSDQYEIINGYRYQKGHCVKTRGQVNAPALKACEVLSEDVISGIYDSMHEDFPNVIILGEPTTSYNCHSYAWYNSTIYNDYWIASIESFVNDVHTVPVEPEGKTVGNIAVYINANGAPLHSAIIIDTNGDQVICESKWGAGVLCQHEIGDVPEEYMATNTQCWILYYDLTPHDYGYLSHGNATHTKTCTICPYSETESCNLTYPYIGDSMHNIFCTECDYGISGAYCAYSYQADANGTHKKICTLRDHYQVTENCTYQYVSNGYGSHTRTCTVCDESTTVGCDLVYTSAGVNHHTATCADCGYTTPTQGCTYSYTGNGDSTHERTCTLCGNSMDLPCEMTYEYLMYNQHRAECTLCGDVIAEDCTAVATYCGDGSTNHIHANACQDCGNAMSSATESCTLEYVFAGTVNGTNTHSRVCTGCEYVQVESATCFYKNSDYCFFCGTHWDAVQAASLDEMDTIE